MSTKETNKVAVAKTASPHKLLKNDYDLFNIMYKSGNDYLDSSLINSFIKTQNIPMLVESVCHVLDLCARYGQNVNTIISARDPTLIGNRFALKGVIDALGINQGHIDASNEYTISLISLVFTYNPEAIHFVSLLRSAKNWTRHTFLNAFTTSPFFSYINTLQYEMPYVPFSLLTRLRISRALELAFIKYTRVAPVVNVPKDKKDTTITTTNDENPHKLNIIPSLTLHHAAFTKELSNIANINTYLPSYMTSPLLSSQPKTILYQDEFIETPIHIPTSAAEFLSYFVFSPFAGYGLDIKQFTDEIPSVLLRYLSMSIQSYNWEAFKFLLSVDLYMNISGDDDYAELQSTAELDHQQAVYNALPYNERYINLPNPSLYDLKTHVPQAVRIGNMMTEGIVTQVLRKYTCIEKITLITKELDELTKLLPKAPAVAPVNANEDDNTEKILTKNEINNKIDVLKLKAQSYYHEAQLVMRFHEGLFSLYKYDLATPSQLIILYIAAYCYKDELILGRLKECYGITEDTYLDYDNTTHLEHLGNADLKVAYKAAIADTAFKQQRKTLLHEIFATFSTTQLPRCIEHYVFKIKRKKSIIDLSLPVSPLAIAIAQYDVDISFLEWLIEKGSPFLPHSRFGDQYNVVLSLLRSTYDQPQDRTVELLNWCQKYTNEKTKEKIVISMDEFFAFMAKITRLPLQCPTTIEQINDNIQSAIASSGYDGPIIPPVIPIKSNTALSLYPQPSGYRRKVLQWVWDNALDMAEWRKQVMSSPDVVVKALTGLLEVNEPTPLSFSQNSVEYQFFEEDLMTMLKFFVVPQNASVLFLHQKFASIVGQLVAHRSVRIFKYLFELGYVLDKQVIYLFSMSTPTFNSYNDYNVYVPSYRELVTSKDNAWNKKWRKLEDKKIPLLTNERISSQQQGQRLVSESEFILMVTRGPKDKLPTIPKYIRAQKSPEEIEKAKLPKEKKKKRVKKVRATDAAATEGEVTAPVEEEVEFDADGNEIPRDDKTNKNASAEKASDTATSDDKTAEDVDNDDDYEWVTDDEADDENDLQFDDFDEDWANIQWSKLSPAENRIKVEKLKLIYRQQLDLSMEETQKFDKEVYDSDLSYQINYDFLPSRLPPQCPKFQSLHRFNLASKNGLSQLISSGLLVDYKKEDVLGKCQIPKLQFDSLQSLCLPSLQAMYPDLKSRSQMELLLSSASKSTLGKCCWTVFHYLQQTYGEGYDNNTIPFSQQSSTLALLLLFLQYCPDIEYALYMLMTPIDGVGFVASCYQWLLYKIVVETFPTAAVPFSLFGKLYFYSPYRVTSSLLTHLSTSLMFEDVLRHSIDSFNRYTIASREELAESNEEVYAKVVQAHQQALKKAVRQQQLTGKEIDVPKEPPSLFELGLQEYKYELTYHGSTVHSFKTKEESEKFNLPSNSPLITYSPLSIIDNAPSPAISSTVQQTHGQYINQKYFNMLSFDTQTTMKNSGVNNNTMSNGIFVSHLAQRALIALVCDMLYQYKLDEEISKESQTNRDIRECGKNSIDRNQFISSLTIFRRIFNYIRYIPLQIVFFITHLVPTTDLYMYFDVIELHAFFTQTGRDGIFNQDAMFLAQPLQYHVYPITLPYRYCITNVLSLMYEFNGEYALNKVDENVKLMSGEQQQQPKGDAGEEAEKPQELKPPPELTQYNMGNYYTLYYDVPPVSIGPDGKELPTDTTTTLANADNIYRLDMIPQRSNALNPYIMVDLDGSLLINEEAETQDDVYRTALPQFEDFNSLPLLWVKLCETTRTRQYGNNSPPADIPMNLMLKHDDLIKKGELGQDIASVGTDTDKSAQSEGNDAALINAHSDPSSDNGTGGGIGGYLMPIGLGLVSLVGLAAGALYFINNVNNANPHSESTPTTTNPTQQRKRKRPAQQQ